MEVALLYATFHLFISLLVVIGVWAIIAVIKNARKQHKNHQENLNLMKDKLSKLDDFKVSKETKALNCILAIDEDSKKIAVIDSERDYLFNFDQLIESEIIKDSTTITKVSRSSQLTAAAIGGALAGGTGAVIGALGGKRETVSNVKKLTLKLVFDILSTPNMYVVFLNHPTSLRQEDPRLVAAINSIDHWYGIASTIMNRNKKASGGNWD